MHTLVFVCLFLLYLLGFLTAATYDLSYSENLKLVVNSFQGRGENASKEHVLGFEAFSYTVNSPERKTPQLRKGGNCLLLSDLVS